MEIIKEIKKPFNVVMLILACASILFTIFFYFLSIKKSEISYSIEPSTKIIDSKLTGQNIKIFNENNQEIQSDIFSSSIIVWNSGDLTIKEENVRVIPSIEITGINHLINNPTISESDPEVTKFSLSKDTTNLNVFNLFWKHFDPGNAIRINFLYTPFKEQNFDVVINGKILGIKEFRKLEPEPFKDQKLRLCIGLGFLLLLITMSTYLMISKNRSGSLFEFYFNSLIGIPVAIYFIFFFYKNPNFLIRWKKLVSNLD